MVVVQKILKIFFIDTFYIFIPAQRKKLWKICLAVSVLASKKRETDSSNIGPFWEPARHQFILYFGVFIFLLTFSLSDAQLSRAAFSSSFQVYICNRIQSEGTVLRPCKYKLGLTPPSALEFPNSSGESFKNSYRFVYFTY